MIFVCATFDRSASGDTSSAASRMAAARRTARAHAVQILRCGDAHVAAAGCTIDAVSAGAVQVCLFRPQHGAGAPALDELKRVAAAWQADARLPDLPFVGPFVLLLVDDGRGEMVAAGDRFGACLLYFHGAAERVRIATDIDALCAGLDFTPAIDRQAIYDYVFFHCIPGPRTIYREIGKTGPAERLRFAQGVLDRDTYWQPRFAGAADTAPEPDDLLDVLEAAVRRSVVDDCGAFLSGGLDSSTVAGLLSRARAPARTFTIGFDAAGYDESEYARMAARHFGTEQHEYFVTPADVCEALPLIAAHYGEPFGNSSVVPAFCCARFAREHGVAVMLAGDGGDELFAGNTRYLDQNVFEAWFRVPAVLRTVIEAGYERLPLLARLPLAAKGASYIRRARMGLPDRLHTYNFLNEFDPATVFDRDWLSGVEVEAPWVLWRERYGAPEQGSKLQRMLYLDWKFTLSDNDLMKVNHMCDLAGVEAVYPMLDPAVADFACRLPDRALLRGGALRGYYKHAVRDFLPQAIIDKSKHGFGLPFGVWMRDDSGLEAIARDAFAGLAERGIFDREFLERALRLHQEDTAGYYGELVWILTMLELWFEAHER